MVVLRVRSQSTIYQADVRALILRAVEATRYPGTVPLRFYEELCVRISEPGLGVFVSYDDGPRAIVVAMLPGSALMMAPQVPLVYSDGKPSLLRALSSRLRGWLLENGYDRALGINLYREDEVFMRGFAHFGRPGRVGSLIEFDLR
jgi:hypothetical protein